MGNLYRLVYVSSAKNKYAKVDLLGLLHKAREKNTRLGITGLLLYKDGNFMQLIEGEKTAIHALFDAILADPDHHQVVMMIDEPCEERLFAEWRMGFYDLDDPALTTLPGFSPFMNFALHDIWAKHDASGCMALFELFRRQR